MAKALAGEFHGFLCSLERMCGTEGGGTRDSQRIRDTVVANVSRYSKKRRGEL